MEEFHTLRIELAPSEPVKLSASFVSEHGGHKVVKLFREEYQAGDARFDDAIYIRDEYRPATEKLLANEGAREAILQLVGGEGTLLIKEGTIEFELRHRGAIDEPAYVRAALVLSRHVSRLD